MNLPLAVAAAAERDLEPTIEHVAVALVAIIATRRPASVDSREYPDVAAIELLRDPSTQRDILNTFPTARPTHLITLMLINRNRLTIDLSHWITNHRTHH